MGICIKGDHPSQKLIYSRGTSGWAGLLHESVVYAWDAEGRTLNRLRSSVWDTLSETVYDENVPTGSMVYSQRYDDTVIVETYTDYENGSTVVFSNATKDYDDPQFAAGRFLYEDEFLGLEAAPADNNGLAHVGVGHQSVTETVLLRIKKHMVPLAEPQVVYPDADIRFHYGSAQEPVCIPELRLSAQQTKRTLSARFYGIPDRYGIDVISHSIAAS